MPALRIVDGELKSRIRRECGVSNTVAGHEDRVFPIVSVRQSDRRRPEVFTGRKARRHPARAFVKDQLYTSIRRNGQNGSEAEHAELANDSEVAPSPSGAELARNNLLFKRARQPQFR